MKESPSALLGEWGPGYCRVLAQAHGDCGDLLAGSVTIGGEVGLTVLDRAGDEAFGHATAFFTLDVYGHSTDRMKRESAEKMEKCIHTVAG